MKGEIKLSAGMSPAENPRKGLVLRSGFVLVLCYVLLDQKIKNSQKICASFSFVEVGDCGLLRHVVRK